MHNATCSRRTFCAAAALAAAGLLAGCTLGGGADVAGSAGSRAQAGSAQNATAQASSSLVSGEAKEVPTRMLNDDRMIPLLGLGTYSLTGDTCEDSVYDALERGYRLIDTAYMYHNEAEVGRAVRRAVADGICAREDITVTTKLYPTQYDEPEAAIERALAALDIGAIDLMLLHHPGVDDAAAYRAMERYQQAGDIVSLGISCYYRDELDSFLPKVSVRPVLVQNEIHPYYQDRDNTRYIQSLGIDVEAWYPLGGRGHQDELLFDPVLDEIAQAHGASIAQVILRWNHQNGVIVIPGSSDPAHMEENRGIFSFELTEDEMARIADLERHEKHDWY